MTLKKNLDTPESRAFWKHVEETAKRVQAWPAWKRGEPEKLTPKPSFDPMQRIKELEQALYEERQRRREIERSRPYPTL